MSLLTERLAPGYREAIDHAVALIPANIRDLIHADFLTGINPNYVGLHRFIDAGYGWSYSKVAHASRGTNDRRAVIVLPQSLREMERTYWTDGPGITPTILHELGHVLDYRLLWRPDVHAVSDYGRTNQLEAFAEAFSEWVLGRPSVLELAPEAAAFLEELAA